MYPTLKTWIRAPTPVTTSSITDERWSTWNARSTCSGPTGIHCQATDTTGEADPAADRTTTRAVTKAATTTPTPITLTARFSFGRKKLIAPFARNPASGHRTTSHTREAAISRVTG